MRTYSDEGLNLVEVLPEPPNKFFFYRQKLVRNFTFNSYNADFP